MKRNILFALSAIVLGVAGYVGYQQVSASSESDLFLANVEALSSGEGITNTSWQCSGKKGVCSASCHQCGTKVSGTGHLEGEHSCIVN